jgi:hypothetical protein
MSYRRQGSWRDAGGPGWADRQGRLTDVCRAAALVLGTHAEAHAESQDRLAVRGIPEQVTALPALHLRPETAPDGFTVNQFLVDSDEPLLYHTGMRALVPRPPRGGRDGDAAVAAALDRVRSPGGRRVRRSERVPGLCRARIRAIALSWYFLCS